MSVEDIKSLERRFFEELNKGKAAGMAVLNELVANDIVFHSGRGEDIRGLKDFKQYYSGIYSAFPDVHFTIDDMVVEGDKAVIRWTVTCTHKGEYRGIPPTNKKVTKWAIQIDRIAGDKYMEIWERFDTLSWMKQLGVVPTPEQGQR